MQQDKKKISTLLERFRNGQLSKPERYKIFRWLAGLDLLDRKHGIQDVNLQMHRSWQELEPQLSVIQPPKILIFPMWARTVAAAVLLLAVFGVWRFSQTLPETRHQIAWHEVATATGEIKRIRLSDGSVITLNSESKLKYPQSFESGQREVILAGQGFFDIVHDTAHPFRVQAGAVVVQVLGTSFDVKAYDSEPDIRVGVATGMVGVMTGIKGKQETILLKQGKGVVYDLASKALTLTQTDIARIRDWQQNRLVYKNEPLAAIGRDLERHFAVHFVFKNEQLKARRLSLDIKSPKLETALKALSLSGNFKYSIIKNRITVW